MTSPEVETQMASEVVRDQMSGYVRFVDLFASLGLFVFIVSFISFPFVAESTTTVLTDILWVFTIAYLVTVASFIRLFVSYGNSVKEPFAWLWENGKLYVGEWICSVVMFSLMGVLNIFFNPLPIVWGVFFFAALSSAVMEQLVHYVLTSNQVVSNNLSAEDLAELSDEEVQRIVS